MSSANDAHWMAYAIRLAEHGLYTTDPNPRVGSVIVRDGQLVGEGYHARAGEPHAERLALADAGAKAKGATVYVTLEPCCHHGKTPPCSDALIEAGVARVVIAMRDPNPQVAGGGISQLEAAGIETTTGVLEAQARALNPGFISRMERGRPWVRCKLAMSVDGRTAMSSGESKWITSESSRLDVQRLRARSSAIITGIGTVLADDPSLNVRLDASAFPGVSEAAQLTLPLRLVMDADLRMPPNAQMLSLPGETMVVTASGDADKIRAIVNAGAEVLTIDRESGHLDWQDLLRELAAREINEVLIEAGATLAGSAMQAGVIDELVIYMAPHLMGDAARGLMHLPGLDTMAQRISLQLADMRQFGNDLRMTYRVME